MSVMKSESLSFPSLAILALFTAITVIATGCVEESDPEEETEEDGDVDLLDQLTPDGTAELFVNEFIASTDVIECGSPLYYGAQNIMDNLGYSEASAADNCVKFKNDQKKPNVWKYKGVDVTFERFEYDSLPYQGQEAIKGGNVYLSDGTGFPIERMILDNGEWKILFMMEPGNGMPY